MSEEVKQYHISEPWLHLDCGLGEAPFWEKSKHSLRFVDIFKKHIYFVDLNTGPLSLQKHKLDFSISTTADIENDSHQFIFGGKLGYGLYNRDTGKTRWLKKVWNDDERKNDGGGKPGKGDTREERMRSNDGAVDSRGRYWVGTMNDPVVVDGNITDEGVLFRLDNDLALHRIKSGLSIPNGMSWTDDDRGFYFTDSPTKKIELFPYNADDDVVSIGEAKTFFICPFKEGVPDGHCRDAEGFFWVCCFGAGKVVRVNLEGKIVAQVNVPTRCVSCPVICGTTLYICSAEEEDPENHPESVQYQGSVFRVDIGIGPGPVHKFKPTVPL